MLRGSQLISKRRKVGLVIVHGVGEAEPGYCLDAVISKLESRKQPDGTPRYEFATYSEYERLDEVRGAKGSSGTFPVFSRQGMHADGTRVSAVELFWADTTALRPGRINTLLGLIRVIFESQHLVHAMLDRGKNAGAWVSHHVLLIAAWMLRGPIAAATFAVSLFCSVLLFEPQILRSIIPHTHLTFLIVQGLLFGTALWVLVAFVVKRREMVWYDFVFWLLVITAVLIVLDTSGLLFKVLDTVPSLKTADRIAQLLSRVLLVSELPAVQITSLPDCTLVVNADGCYVSGLYKVIIWMWRLWGMLVLMVAGIGLIAWAHASRKSDRAVVSAVVTSIGILVLQFLLWTTIVVSVLYPMLNRAESNAALNKLLDAASNRSGLESQLAENYKISLDPLLTTAKKYLHLIDIHPEWIFRFKFIYVAATATLLLFVLGAGLIMYLRRKWAFSGLQGLAGEELDARLRYNARRMPRLLFNRRLVFILILAFLIVMMLIYWQSLIEFNPMFASFRSLFLPVAALIAIVVPLAFGPWTTNVVHIARDLIDHHYQPRLETAAIFLPRLFKPETGMPRRRRIQDRLLVLLDHYFRDGGCTDIVFLAHSQGSVVVYDYLRSAAAGHPKLGGAQATFISCGSPLGTIYQTYFYEYGLGNPEQNKVRLNVKRWINLYRVDDYISGAVTGPSGVEFSNKILKPGENRHMYYWNEDAVVVALDAFVSGVAGSSITE